MKYVFGLPNDNELNEVMTNYYNFFDESYGPDPLNFYTKKHFDIVNPSKILKLDENFRRTTNTISELYSSNNMVLFRIFDEEGKLLAISRVRFDFDVKTITIGEIILTPNVIEEDREFIFSEVIEYLENYFLTHNVEIFNEYNDELKKDIVKIKNITCEVPKYREDSIEYINVLLMYDYEPIKEPNSVNSNYITNLYTKNIRRKPQILDIKQFRK